MLIVSALNSRSLSNEKTDSGKMARARTRAGDVGDYSIIDRVPNKQSMSQARAYRVSVCTNAKLDMLRAVHANTHVISQTAPTSHFGYLWYQYVCPPQRGFAIRVLPR